MTNKILLRYDVSRGHCAVSGVKYQALTAKKKLLFRFVHTSIIVEKRHNGIYVVDKIASHVIPFSA